MKTLLYFRLILAQLSVADVMPSIAWAHDDVNAPKVGKKSENDEAEMKFLIKFCQNYEKFMVIRRFKLFSFMPLSRSFPEKSRKRFCVMCQEQFFTCLTNCNWIFLSLHNFKFLSLKC